MRSLLKTEEIVWSSSNNTRPLWLFLKSTFPVFAKSKIIPALTILFGVVLTAAVNILPIVVSAIIGCTLLILTKCIDLEETYQAIQWNVILLLAGVLTLGVALEKTGAAYLISDLLISIVGNWRPVALVSALFFLTMMLTSVMFKCSNCCFTGANRHCCRKFAGSKLTPISYGCDIRRLAKFYDTSRLSNQHTDLWRRKI